MKIKPCPFKHKYKDDVPASVWRYGPSRPGVKPWCVSCPICKTHGPWRRTENGSIRAWNARD